MYVTWGVEVDLAPLHSTINVSCIYNTPMTSVTLSSSFRKTLKWNSPDQDNWDIVVVTCCCALHLCSWCITRPLGTIRAPTPLVWTITRPWRPPNKSFYDRPATIFGKCSWSGHETNVGTNIDREPPPTVVPSWLSAAGTSQEVWSLIWHHSQALPMSSSYITLHYLKITY